MPGGENELRASLLPMRKRQISGDINAAIELLIHILVRVKVNTIGRCRRPPSGPSEKGKLIDMKLERGAVNRP
jgi:hypothetical protein